MMKPLLAAIVTIAAFLSTTGPASAAALSIVQPESLPRLDRDGRQIAKRPLTLTPEGISLADCREDQRIRFTLLLDQFAANAELQAWASVSGGDCRAQTSRSGMAPTCWPLSLGIPLQPVASLDVPVRSILRGVNDPRGASDDASVCGTVDLTTVSVQFLYFEPGAPATPAVAAMVGIAADTIPSAPPASVVATSGEGRVVVSWEPRGAEGALVGDTATNVYCAPTTREACGSIDATAPLCATAAGALASVVAVTSLPEGAPHAFAAASVDAFGNEGAVSPPSCAAAGPAVEGLVAEGGGCVAAPTRPRTQGALALVAAATLATLTRRRRGCTALPSRV